MQARINGLDPDAHHASDHISGYGIERHYALSSAATTSSNASISAAAEAAAAAPAPLPDAAGAAGASENDTCPQ